MIHHREHLPHETVTLVDHDGNVWARLNCRDCLLKDRKQLRLPVWVLRGTGSGLCLRCRELHEEPIGRQGFNPNVLRSDVHRKQYDGEALVSGEW